MGFATRLLVTRKSAVPASVALMVGLLGSSGAWAQCTDNFNFVAFGGTRPVSTLAPLGTGSSLSTLTSTINTINTAFLTTTSAFVSAPGGAQPDQQGGGAWSRAIAGSVDTTTSSKGILDVSTLAPPQPPATGSQNCKTTTHQDYAGFQVGRDISILNGGGSGANWHFGVTAGYVETFLKDTTSAGTYTNGGFTFNTPAGSFHEATQVPFVGLYTAYTKGNFFADGQVRWDFFQNSLSDSNNGLIGQSLDARGVSLTGNLGYNIPLHNNWFIEPSAGVVLSRVHIDPLNVPGVIVGGFSVARGSVTIDDIESALGRASIRVGTTISGGQITWQPYFTASVFHEFAGDVTASSRVIGADPSINGLLLTTSSTGGVGTYGQFALGTAAVLGNTGWLGYGRVDYRIGENIEGWSINAGLRYQFSPQPRGSIKDGPAPVSYSYNWSGPYIGTFGGTAWGDARRFSPSFGTTVVPDFAGWIAGGEAGYNIQHGRWVYGIEADYDFTNAHGGVSCANAFNFTCEAKVNELASVAGRLGITWGRALFYAKGGWAGGQVNATARDNTGAVFVATGTSSIGSTHWQNGWTVGGGMEFAISDRWSVKAEYMHFDLGSANFTSSPNFVVVDTHGDSVRLGMNLHFNQVQREVPLK